MRISEHGYDPSAEDGILIRDIVGSASDGQLVEDCPDYPKGPCVLVLQYDRNGQPIHVGDPEREDSASGCCHCIPAGR